MGQHRIEGRIKITSCGDASLFFKRPGWELCLTLQPWRGEGGSIRTSELNAIAHNLDRETAQALAQAHTPGQIVRIAVADCPAPEDDKHSVAIVTLEGEIEDAPLTDFAVPEPVFPPYHHPVLGHFAKTRDYQPYEGRADWNGTPIRLNLDGDFANLAACADAAAIMLANAGVWQAELTARAYEKMYANWNAVWREDDPDLTEAEWTARLTIEALSMTADGEFTVTFTDGDLFWGHWVEVSGSLGTGVTDAVMVG
jgi:hypothetical protein